MHTLRFAVLAAFFVSATAAARAPEVGDVVFAEWQPGDWYHGKADARCDGGLHVLFDDKDKACIKLAGIVLDRVPEPEDVRVGVRVLARWDDGKFYPGKVAELRGRTAIIAYDDGDKGDAGIGDLRLLPR